MITFLGLDIKLPASLIFLSGKLGSFLITVLVFVITGLFLHFLIFKILYPFFRKTETEIDDIIMATTYKPFLFIFCMFGVEKSLETIGPYGWVIFLERVVMASFAIAVTIWLANLFRDVAILQLKLISKRSETDWENIFLPTAKTLIPPLIYGLGIVFALEFIGLDLTSLYVAIGGVAFILGFALQDVLSNLFSGIALLVDAPFQVDDVIKMDGENIAVIKRVGLRVTHVYDSQHHVDIFIPNSIFGSSNIINITRPTTDLAEKLVIGIGYAADQKKAKQILTEVVNGHPDVFASEGFENERQGWIAKFGSFVEAGEGKILASKTRIERENNVNNKLEELEINLGIFSRLAARLEKGGLDYAEIQELKKGYQQILETIGLKEKNISLKHTKKKKDNLEINTQDKSNLISAINEWLKASLEDPNLVPDDKPDLHAVNVLCEQAGISKNEINYLTGEIEDEDLGKLCKEWAIKVRRLIIKIERGYDWVQSPEGHERVLDSYSSTLREWVQKDFKQRAVGWRDPDIYLVNAGASSLDFEINYYVDNIKLEHWERSDRIKHELLSEVIRRFQEDDIEIPFPQTDIWFRNSLESHNKE